MMESEARYMRRKVKAGRIEVDEAECALIVHYEVEATVLGEMGEPIVAERQEKQNKIRLKTLKEDSNIPRLAEEIVDKCKLIPASKLDLVQALLRQLQERQVRTSRKKDSSLGGGASKKKGKAGGSSGEASANADAEKPALDQLDRYIERMYDGTEAATQATHMVLQLSRDPENLEALISNEALVGLLSRVLHEEGKRSMELAINILYVLYAFSSFSQFHQPLAQSSVGAHILRIVDLETKRHVVREHERKSEQAAAPSSDVPVSESDSQKMAEKRHRLAMRKQEKLLYVCFHVLLNLAEDPESERKMAKKGLVSYLAPLLERDNIELRVLVLVFLKKLAIFKENLPALREKKVATALAPFIPSTSEAVLVTALRLLYNLSFDAKCREAILGGDLLNRLIACLRKRMQLPLVLRVLYNLSCDDKARKAMCKADHVGVALRKQVISCEDHMLPPELAALAINIATVEAGAEAMCSDQVMRHYLERLYQTHDLMLLKLLRNLTTHEGPALQAGRYAADLFALVQQVEGEELLVELLGLIGNLRLRSLPDLSRLVQRYGLVEFLHRQLVPGFSEDDVLLEVVVVAGELAADAECATLLSRSGAVFIDVGEVGVGDSRATLYSLITDKQEDDEFVLQLLFCFYRLLQADEPRDTLLQSSQIVVYLLDLLLDLNEEVKKMASRCLDAVAEADEAWAAQIRQRKFQIHNAQWLELVDEDEAEEYQDAVALNQAMQSLHMNEVLDASQLDNELGDNELGDGSEYSSKAGSPLIKEGGFGYGAPYAREDEGYGGANLERAAYELAQRDLAQRDLAQRGGYDDAYDYDAYAASAYEGGVGYAPAYADGAYADGANSRGAYGDAPYGGRGAYGGADYGDYADNLGD